MGRVLAIDYGSKLIGLALSDETQTFAFPYLTLSNKSSPLSCETLIDIIKKEAVKKVIIGRPKHLDGSESDFERKVVAFGNEIQKEINTEIEYIDERYTTEHAKQEFMRKTKQKITKDQLQSESARLILQKYIEMKK